MIHPKGIECELGLIRMMGKLRILFSFILIDAQQLKSAGGELRGQLEHHWQDQNQLPRGRKGEAGADRAGAGGADQTAETHKQRIIEGRGSHQQRDDTIAGGSGLGSVATLPEDKEGERRAQFRFTDTTAADGLERNIVRQQLQVLRGKDHRTQEGHPAQGELHSEFGVQAETH